jgi:hypothetical protein
VIQPAPFEDFKVVFNRAGSYVWRMRRLLAGLIILTFLGPVQVVLGATGSVLKVLPEFLDLKGRNSLSPSLYERDGYQATLRDHPERRSGIRFYIEWRSRQPLWEPLLVRLELRGAAAGRLPRQLVLERSVANQGGPLSHWVEIPLVGDQYKKFGSVTAWRVTLWEGQKLIGREQSFLW